MVGFSTGSVERALEILELLVDRPEGLSLTAIAEPLEMPKSAAHKLLNTLIVRRYVSQDPLTQHYKLTMHLVSLGFRQLGATKLPEICQPVLDDLASQTEELVRMTVVDGDSLVWVAKAQGATETLRVDPIMARSVVLHATATGKAWLATLPEKDALRIVLHQGFDSVSVGPNALRSVDQLRDELRKTRTRGYGVVNEEAEPGVAAIAAAIRASNSRESPAVGTVSVAGPSVRLTRKRIGEIAPALLAAASELSRLWPVREQHALAKPRRLAVG
jgi:IclR family transcriptional regulator, acetate operon repressor